MSIRLPALPPHSWIRAEDDGLGPPRLTWQQPFTWGGYGTRIVLLVSFTGGVGYFMYEVMGRDVLRSVGLLPGGVAPGGPADNPFRIVASAVGVAGLLVLALTALWVIYKAFRIRRPDRLTLGPDRLRYESESEFWPCLVAREVPRSALGRVWLHRGERWRQRLMLEDGAELAEVGKYLRAPDQVWLAEVLRRWAAEEEPAPTAALVPPRNSTLTAESGPGGQLTLRWRPAAPQVGWERWVNLAVMTAVLPAFLSVIGVFLWMFVGMLTAPGGGGGPGGELLWRWFPLGFVLFCALFLASGTAAMLRVYWYLLRGPRWARLTLTSTTLRYEAGRYLERWTGRGIPRVCAGPVCVVPRAELGEVRFERTAGGGRLTVDHGVERFEIGPTLRDLEQEWLAERLRAWAGRSQAPDRQPAAG
jgi:hypothetical protein